MQDLFQRQEQRITELERTTDVIDQKLLAMQQILETLKDVVVELNEAMREIVRVQERQTAMEDNLMSLRAEFKEQIVKTDPLINQGVEFMQRWKGGVRVALIALAVIEGGVAYYLSSAIDRLSSVEVLSRQTHMEVLSVKRDIRTHELRDYEAKTGPIPMQQ